MLIVFTFCGKSDTQLLQLRGKSKQKAAKNFVFYKTGPNYAKILAPSASTFGIWSPFPTHNSKSFYEQESIFVQNQLKGQLSKTIK